MNGSNPPMGSGNDMNRMGQNEGNNRNGQGMQQDSNRMGNDQNMMDGRNQNGGMMGNNPTDRSYGQTDMNRNGNMNQRSDSRNDMNRQGEQQSRSSERFSADRQDLMGQLDESITAVDKQLERLKADVPNENRSARKTREDAQKDLQEKRRQLIDQAYKVQRVQENDFRQARRETNRLLDDVEDSMEKMTKQK